MANKIKKEKEIADLCK